MARKSISRRASSSKAGNRITMPASAFDLLMSMKKIKYPDTIKHIRVHLSRFFSMARKAISRLASSSSTAADSSKPGNKSKPSSTYQCYPFSYINKYHGEDGNKIVPASALDVLVLISQFCSMAKKSRKSISRFLAKGSKSGKSISKFLSMARKSRSRRPSSSKAGGDTSKPSFTCQWYPFSHIKKYHSEDAASALGVLLLSISQRARKSRKSISRYFPLARKSISQFVLMARKSRSRSASSSSKSGATSKPSFTYQCYPFSHINKYRCKDGNKIIMPASALDVLLSMKKIKYPMTFMITNPFLGKVSHCGVLEFSAEEGNVYLPNWMMNNLTLQQGQVVNVEYTGLSKATSLKIQPHSTKLIMNLSDPKEISHIDSKRNFIIEDSKRTRG